MGLEKRILVVDDDDAIRALVSTVLRRRGYRVDVARNGVDAMEKIVEHRYALVVLDLMMPRMSGFEVLDRLGEQPVAARPLVLLLTAGNEPRAAGMGFVVGTIHKPFDIGLLLDSVAGCLASVQQEADPEGIGNPAENDQTRPN